MKYIDADKLKEDIQANLAAISFNDDYQKGYEACGMSVLKSIDSLQKEQPGLPGIEENGVPGKDYIPVEWVDACEEYGKWEIVKKEQSEGIEGVVHHYANVHYIFTNKEQLNARLKDFEEGAEVRIFINARKEE